MIHELSPQFIRCVNQLLRHPLDDLERVRLIMEESWNGMVARNSSFNQIEFPVRKICAKMVTDLKNGRLRESAKLATIVTSIFMLVEQSKYRAKGLILMIEGLSCYYHPLWTKHLERLSETLVLIDDGPGPKYLARAVPEYWLLLTKLTKHSKIRLIVGSTLSNQSNVVPVVASRMCFRDDEMCIRGIYMRPLITHTNLSLIKIMHLQIEDTKSRIDNSRDESDDCFEDELLEDDQSGEPNSFECFETIEHGLNLSEICEVDLPLIFQDILQQMGVGSRAKSARFTLA